MSLCRTDVAGGEFQHPASEDLNTDAKRGEIGTAGEHGVATARNRRIRLSTRSRRAAGGTATSSHANEPPVLVVDDDSDWRTLTRHMLAKAGIANPVVAVASVDAAKTYLRACCPSAGGRRSAKPAVVLLDINMPASSGFDVLKWIKRKNAFRRTKVIMWSSSEDEKDRQRAVELKADAYLVKHSLGSIVAAAVRACIDKHARPRAALEPSTQA